MRIKKPDRITLSIPDFEEQGVDDVGFEHESGYFTAPELSIRFGMHYSTVSKKLRRCVKRGVLSVYEFDDSHHNYYNLEEVMKVFRTGGGKVPSNVPDGWISIAGFVEFCNDQKLPLRYKHPNSKMSQLVRRGELQKSKSVQIQIDGCVRVLKVYKHEELMRVLVTKKDTPKPPDGWVTIGDFIDFCKTNNIKVQKCGFKNISRTANYLKQENKLKVKPFWADGTRGLRLYDHYLFDELIDVFGNVVDVKPDGWISTPAFARKYNLIYNSVLVKVKSTNVEFKMCLSENGKAIKHFNEDDLVELFFR